MKSSLHPPFPPVSLPDGYYSNQNPAAKPNCCENSHIPSSLLCSSPKAVNIGHCVMYSHPCPCMVHVYFLVDFLLHIGDVNVEVHLSLLQIFRYLSTHFQLLWVFFQPSAELPLLNLVVFFWSSSLKTM